MWNWGSCISMRTFKSGTFISRRLGSSERGARLAALTHRWGRQLQGGTIPNPKGTGRCDPKSSGTQYRRPTKKPRHRTKEGKPRGREHSWRGQQSHKPHEIHSSHRRTGTAHQRKKATHSEKVMATAKEPRMKQHHHGRPPQCHKPPTSAYTNEGKAEEYPAQLKVAMKPA